MAKRETAARKVYTYSELSGLARQRIDILRETERREGEVIDLEKSNARRHLVQGDNWLHHSEAAVKATVRAARAVVEINRIYSRGSLGIKRK